jgi:hypothetical protein
VGEAVQHDGGDFTDLGVAAWWAAVGDTQSSNTASESTIPVTAAAVASGLPKPV